jgi:hypothetical protein
MAKEIKLKKSFGSVTIDRFSPKAKKATQRRKDAKTQRKHFEILPLRPCALASLRSLFSC